MRPVNESDGQLVRSARAGDRHAFGVLVARYLRAALAVAWEYAPSQDDAEDLVQEAFHRALGGLARFDERLPFRPWLFTIIRNLGRNVAERDARWSTLAVPETLADDEPDPAEFAHRALVRDRIDRGLDALPPMQRACFRLCDIEGFDVSEVAEMLGVAGATVRTHRHRARATLRRALHGLEEERKRE